MTSQIQKAADVVGTSIPRGAKQQTQSEDLGYERCKQ
jgi:hypothetical protein